MNWALSWGCLGRRGLHPGDPKESPGTGVWSSPAVPGAADLCPLPGRADGACPSAREQPRCPWAALRTRSLARTLLLLSESGLVLSLPSMMTSVKQSLHQYQLYSTSEPTNCMYQYQSRAGSPTSIKQNPSPTLSNRVKWGACQPL